MVSKYALNSYRGTKEEIERKNKIEEDYKSGISLRNEILSKLSVYTNKDLAEDYIIIASRFVIPFKSNSTLAQKRYETKRIDIRDSKIDIVKFYAHENSLDNLKIDGIGKKSKCLLSNILGYRHPENIFDDSELFIIGKRIGALPNNVKYDYDYKDYGKTRLEALFSSG